LRRNEAKMQREEKDLTQRAQRESLEDTEKKRGLVALERKRPPFADGAKGAAPSSFNVRGVTKGGPELLDLFFQVGEEV
jgi:hypothetical protein